MASTLVRFFFGFFFNFFTRIADLNPIYHFIMIFYFPLLLVALNTCGPAQPIWWCFYVKCLAKYMKTFIFLLDLEAGFSVTPQGPIPRSQLQDPAPRM